MSMRETLKQYALVVLGTCAVSVVAIEAGRGQGSQTGVPLHANLTGAAEVPGPGDPDGSGEARLRLNAGRGEICYVLTVSAISPATAAHIHEAPADAAGPVVVNLNPPTDGDASGCTSVDRALVREIVQRPHDYYINVHNADFPPGAVRGQLMR